MPIAVPIGAVVVLFVAWGVDGALNSGTVARNVSVAGVDVGGLDRERLDLELASLAQTYEQTPVLITTADGEVETTAGLVGLELDAQATADNVMAVGRGNIVTRPFRWLGSLVTDRTAEASVRLGPGDEAGLAAVVNAGQPEPTEPTLALENGEVVLISGEAVQIFDLANIRDDVVAAARMGANPIQVQAGALQLNPKRSNEEAQTFVDDFNSRTANGLRVSAGDETRQFDTPELRSWMRIDNSGDVPTFNLSQIRLLASLENSFGTISTVGDNLTIVVVDGEPVLEDFDAQGCCTGDSDELVLGALLGGKTEVTLQLEDLSGSEQELLAEIGVVELISEATTPYSCCQNRVINIQLIADILTGKIMEPGETLSINDFVGRRTREDGFVESGVIYSGRLQTDVGGGISQFATTIFQAMFYGGLNIDHYQPHTLWFSRYEDFEGRRGIESTISFPEPDLEFTNNTPYPVLIWPSYTDTSLTVSLYSTQWTTTEVVDQAIYGSGQCTVIDTERKRTYGDSTDETDSFRAIYQPRDGIGCDGKPTDPSAVTPTPEPEKKKKKKKDAEEDPTPVPEGEPDPEPTADPAPEPTADPAPEPTAEPTVEPTPEGSGL